MRSRSARECIGPRKGWSALQPGFSLRSEQQQRSKRDLGFVCLFALGLETATVPSEISVALAGVRQAGGARLKKKPRFKSRTEGG